MAWIQRQRRRGKSWANRHHRALLWLGGAALASLAMVGLLVFLLEPATWWIGGSAVRRLHGRDKADAINGVRQTLLQAAAGSVALILLLFTGLTFLLNRRGQVTDRYVKAVGLLSSDKLDERLGGIYALEHIMIESERDHETVVQLLAAFVREHSTTGGTRTGLWVDPPVKSRQTALQPAADVQTALTVLGRRPKRLESQSLDLRYVGLRGADLHGARLKNADLSGSDLAHVDLSGADLERATLRSAGLENANLEAARLERADLRSGRLAGADLRSARLTNADLRSARLPRVNLSGAHLENAELNKADLEEANLSGAHLQGADLSHTCLDGAELYRTHLERTNLVSSSLRDADLRSAHLDHAELNHAKLARADLSTATGLAQRQVGNAKRDEQTKLPPYLTMDVAPVVPRMPPVS